MGDLLGPTGGDSTTRVKKIKTLVFMNNTVMLYHSIWNFVQTVMRKVG